MDIITGYTGSPHVTAEQDRDINIGIFGNESYVLQTGSQLTAEVSSNNEIKVRDGVIMHQGCAASIKKNTYDSLTITNGSQGMKRVDLIVARYSRDPSTNVESLALKVIQGTPSENSPTVPGYTTGDIQSGDLVADMPLYQVILNGLNITEVKKLFSLQGSIAELNSNLLNVKADLSKNWEHIGTKTDKSRIYIDETKYKEIFCELRLYDQYLQITFPVKYINNIPTSIEKSFCTGGYQTPQYPGAWAELKTGKMSGAAHPYVYFNRGFVNGNAITNNYGICIWGR